MTALPSSYLKIDIKRYPQRKQELLQAWDAADELILQHLSEVELQGKRILVLNDQFGALSCPLTDLDVTVYTDSYLSSQGIQLNSQNQILPLHELEKLSGIYDWVLIRVPKNMSFFEDILSHLSHHLGAGSKIVCGYMIKHHAKASFELLEKYIGETRTSLAQKKARLIFAEFQRNPSPPPSPIRISVPSFEFPFVNRSNLFSREKLDIGTRFLLEHIPHGDYKTILDLGCGNGLIGVAAKKANPTAKILFSDESWMAIQCAKSNYERFFQDPASFFWTNSFENQPARSVELVLCNPPFHQGNAVGDAVAWQMFKDAHHALREGGLLRVIGNTHLRYPVTLKKIFGNSQIVATNSKFMIVDATK